TFSTHAKEIAMIKVLFKPCTKRLSKVSRAALFVVLLLLPATLLAQGYFGTVSGELTDPTGAVIQGAKVILTDQEKGFTFTATSDSAGHYLFAVTCTGTNFVSNGSRGSTADILTDGASVTNSEPNGGITSATYVPSPEAVEEFKVQQTNFSAEYGFSGASVVNMITRSGTNKFRGSAYDFFRDASLDAHNWFANRAGEPIPSLRRNNYGFTIGGPIIKNKTFFFFD